MRSRAARQTPAATAAPGGVSRPDFGKTLLVCIYGKCRTVLLRRRCSSPSRKLFLIFFELRSVKTVLRSRVANRSATKHRAKWRRRAMLIAAPGGKIQFAEPTARRWLKQFFGRPARVGVLPSRVVRWISKHDAMNWDRSLVATADPRNDRFRPRFHLCGAAH